MRAKGWALVGRDYEEHESMLKKAKDRTTTSLTIDKEDLLQLNELRAKRTGRKKASISHVRGRRNELPR